jgi:hypothetical protein
MKDESMDAILANEEELIPSSGFLATVMERVREEAAAPPPIPFPWKRVLPGMVVAGGVLAWGAVELARSAAVALRGFTPAEIRLAAPPVHALEEAGWVAMALGVSLLSWALSRRLAGRSGLL